MKRRSVLKGLLAAAILPITGFGWKPAPRQSSTYRKWAMHSPGPTNHWPGGEAGLKQGADLYKLVAEELARATRRNRAAVFGSITGVDVRDL